MKIKTLIFWILWVGNNLTLQTASGENVPVISPLLCPGGFDDVILLCETRDPAVRSKHSLQPALA
jgi:hypothetical protein